VVRVARYTEVSLPASPGFAHGRADAGKRDARRGHHDEWALTTPRIEAQNNE
jgi:hypothetical protein